MKTRILIAVLIGLCITVHGFAGERTLKLLTLEWEPYVGSQIPNNGFMSMVVAQAFKKAGYDVAIDFVPWEEALSRGAAGSADGVFPAYHAVERDVSFVFSDVIWQSPLGLCKRRRMIQPSPGGGVLDTGIPISFDTDPRIDQLQALRELAAYKFGVVAGYANTPEFDAADFLVKIQAESDEANIGNLLGGDVQLIVIDKYVAKNIMIKKFPWHSGEVQFMHPALSEKGLYLAVSRKTKDPGKKINAFNAGLRILKEDGVITLLKRQYGF